MRNLWCVSVVCVALLLLCTKTPLQTGTGSETDTAMIYNPDYTPAVGAVVRFFVSSDSTRTIAYQTTTDTKGRYSTKGLTKGMYNMLAYSAKGLAKGAPKMLAANDSLIAYQDSILVLSDTVLVNPDTLEKPGSITGIIGLQPNHDPRTATVQVLGTDLYSNVDANGRFMLAPVAKGNYNLRLVTTLPDYTPTYKTIQTAGQKKDTLADTLWLLYTGIPVVTGLAATYDTVNGVVHLSWNKASYRDFQDYLIFRDAYDSIVLSTNPIAACVDTFYTDTIFKRNLGFGPFSFSDMNDYHFKYRVCIENNSAKRGDAYKYVGIVAASPTKAGMFKCATTSAGFGQRSYQSSVVFNGKMWVMGGQNFFPGIYFFFSDVWYSGDGISWVSVTQQDSFPRRGGHSSLVFDNKMWVIAGFANGERRSDAWYSTDGASWIQATASAGFSSRYFHSSLVFNNKMWLIGGIGDSVLSRNDVWCSADGAAWTQATATAGFSPRYGHTSVVFGNKMWVIAGQDNSGNLLNDVWSSTDGVTWNQATANAGFSPRYGHTSVVYDSLMWVIGGSSINNDAWYSSDGITWVRASDNVGFSPRDGHSSVVFDNKMWVIGASPITPSNPGFSDVWYSDFVIH